MADISFGSGEAYERSMGEWSRIAGAQFLAWLDASPGTRWLDVGCGNAAFTDLIFDHCSPASVSGIDPSEEQLAYARKRLDPAVARFQMGSADELPFPDASFDAVTMALVLFFVAEPDKAVAEMVRVARPGGLIAAYSWDMLHGGFPFDAIQGALRDMGIEPPLPPSVHASQMPVMHKLWSDSGLIDLRTSVIEVGRQYADFDDLWTVSTLVASVRPILARLPEACIVELKNRLRERSPQNADGSITCRARANAIVGRRRSGAYFTAT